MKPEPLTMYKHNAGGKGKFKRIEHKETYE